jgi:hypothetical protein
MLTELPNFEYLSKLAAENPDKLEALRAEHIEQVIENAPQQYRRRLRGLQFQVDCERRKHNTPLASCIAISSMMYDSLHKLNAVLTDSEAADTNAGTQSADILSFPAAAV